MKKNKLKQLSAAAAATLALSAFVTGAAAADETAQPKRSLKGNMAVVYNQLPGVAESFGDMFTDGMWYGRLRMNNFWYEFKDDAAGKYNKATGVGGSLVYKTARYANVAATVGLYYTNGGLINKTDAGDIGTIKSGKDVLSRYQVHNNDDYSMLVPAEANIDIQLGKTNVQFGRLLLESVFTKSNDTKMIPNTFDGIVVENKDVEGTKFTVAHLLKQKLRDHTASHDVITYDTNAITTDHSDWDNNDDSGAHKGLSYKNFKSEGKSTDHTLTILSAASKFGSDLKTEISYLALPEVLSDLVLEAHYTIGLGGTKLIPGIRYFKQMDNGGGKIGGSAINGDFGADKTVTDKKGYKVIDSLDSSITMVRLAIQPKGAVKYLIGYSAVEDAADIVTPWRGFPTGGYTRAMAQVNWYANTKTTMVEANADLGKAGWVPNTALMVRYAMQDYDDAKAGVQADSNILHADIIHKMAAVEGLEIKGRMGVVDGEKKGTKADNSYNEYRLELNYLF